MKILFIHPDCSRPYHGRSHVLEPLGGTEATVIRVAEGLSDRGHCVTVMQGKRSSTEISHNRVRYMPFDDKPAVTPDYEYIILVDTEKLLPAVRRYYKPRRLFLWMHCFPGKARRKRLGDYLGRADAILLAVSETHGRQLEKYIRKFRPPQVRLPAIQVVYNPVSDDLQPDYTPVDENKLVFLSSPHKGLWQVLDHFEKLQKEFPSLRLHIADPGYMKGYQADTLPENVIRLGSVPHPRVIETIRSAFCLFYPQSFFAETFGLVYAEALAVGTPVITHPLGAAPEVIEDKEMLVDANDPQAVLHTLRKWKQEGRPRAGLGDRFRLSSVLSDWESTLGTERPAEMIL